MAGPRIISSIRKPKKVVERNITLLGNLMTYLLAEPEVFNSLPNDFELVILPDDDPEIRLYNLRLLDALEKQGKPIVFVRMKASRNVNLRKSRPNLYVPLAV